MKKKAFIISLFFIYQFGFSQNSDKIKPLFVALEQANSDTAYVQVLFEIGRAYIYQGNLDSAAYYFEKMGFKSKAIKYSYGECKSLLGLGNVVMAKNKYSDAMNYFVLALGIAQRFHFESEKTIANVKIASIYSIQKQYASALLNLKEAASFFENTKDTTRWVGTIAEIQSSYSSMEKWDSSIHYCEKGLTILNLFNPDHKAGKMNEDEFVHRKAILTNGLAQGLFNTNRAAQAVKILEELQEQIKDRNNEIDWGNFLRTISFAYLNNNQFDKTIEYADLGIAACKDKDLPYWNLDFYRARSDAYLHLGNYKKAYEDFVLYKNFSDTVFSNDKFSVIDDMKTKYDTEKKDQTILQLNKEKKSQKIIIGLSIGAAIIALGLFVFGLQSRNMQQKLFKQKEELMIKEKEIEMNSLQKKMMELEQMTLRAQMNPHFIFNSLNSVQHYVMKQDVEGVNKYLGAFAHLIRQTLNNSGKQFVSLDEEIKYLDTYLSLEKMKSNNRFNYTINVNENIDRFTTYIPCMILQPFVENSIKHGVASKQKNDGQICIHVSKNGKLLCIVDDNGIGRQKAGEIKSLSGEMKYESKGMTITMNRIETINKIYNTDITVQIEDKADNVGKPAGTIVKVEFPVDID